MANVRSFSPRAAWGAPLSRPLQPPTTGGIRQQPLSATAQLGGVVRGRAGGLDSSYVSKGSDLNSFSIQSGKGPATNITGLGTIGDEVRIHYTREGEGAQSVAFNSRGLAERIQQRDAALQTLHEKVDKFNSDGIITPDEFRQFTLLSRDVRGLQVRLMAGIDSILNSSTAKDKLKPVETQPAATAPTIPAIVPGSGNGPTGAVPTPGGLPAGMMPTPDIIRPTPPTIVPGTVPSSGGTTTGIILPAPEPVKPAPAPPAPTMAPPSTASAASGVPTGAIPTPAPAIPAPAPAPAPAPPMAAIPVPTPIVATPTPADTAKPAPAPPVTTIPVATPIVAIPTPADTAKPAPAPPVLDANGIPIVNPGITPIKPGPTPPINGGFIPPRPGIPIPRPETRPFETPPFVRNVPVDANGVPIGNPGKPKPVETPPIKAAPTPPIAQNVPVDASGVPIGNPGKPVETPPIKAVPTPPIMTIPVTDPAAVQTTIDEKFTRPFETPPILKTAPPEELMNVADEG